MSEIERALIEGIYLNHYKVFNEEEVKSLINKLKEQVRKETAKEILQDMFDIVKFTGDCTPYRIRKMIKEFAEKYGVEVDE